MSNPEKAYYFAIKNIFQYLSHSKCLRLQFEKNVECGSEIKGFVDSVYSTNLDTRKSLIGFLFTIYGGPVSWKSNMK